MPHNATRPGDDGERRSRAAGGLFRGLASLRLPFGDVPGPFGAPRAPASALDDQPTPAQVRGMRAFWWDGFWANVPETVLATYLGLYVIAFGGSTGQVALVASLSSLFAALAFFPGARLVETFGHRKLIVLATGGGVSRVALLLLAAVPFVARGEAAIWLVIVFASVRAFFGYFAIPAWTSLTADVVPIGIRGRFFASRGFGMSFTALVTAPIAGFLLDRYTGLEGWQIVWLFAFTAAALSTWSYGQIPDPAPHRDVVARAEARRAGGVIASVLSDRNFVWYLAGTAVWNIGLQASGPFFNIYLAEDLHASALWIGSLSALMSVTGLAGLVYFGRLMDERGTKWLMVVTGLLIPVLPAAWVFVTAPWQVIFINTAAGVLWAGYQLATLNMMIVIAPPDQRARYAATSQTVVFAAAFAGPLLGGQIIGMFGYRAVFGFSAVGRMAGTLIVLRFVTARFERGQPALRAGEAAAAP